MARLIAEGDRQITYWSMNDNGTGTPIVHEIRAHLDCDNLIRVCEHPMTLRQARRFAEKILTLCELGERRHDATHEAIGRNQGS